LTFVEVDGRCQELIRSEVTQAFPDHHFLGEEDVPPGAAEAAAAIDAGLSKADWVWIGSSLLILVYSKPAFTSLLLRPFDT
jgi:3'-phosphoadenosine 5'-phosphosulfate (PAPS) 3'-phosphatase